MFKIQQTLPRSRTYSNTLFWKQGTLTFSTLATAKVSHSCQKVIFKFPPIVQPHGTLKNLLTLQISETANTLLKTDA